MRKDRTIRWTGVIALAIVLLQVSRLGAATPLQKIVFVFSGFNGPDQLYLCRQGSALLQRAGIGGADRAGAQRSGGGFRHGGQQSAVLHHLGHRLDAGLQSRRTRSGLHRRHHQQVGRRFVVSSKIATPNDLKGKNLGVQSIGGGVWTFSMLALDHWGLVPERDKIQFRILGDQSVIAQGLISGTVDGAYLGYTFSKTVQRQGFRVLARSRQDRYSLQRHRHRRAQKFFGPVTGRRRAHPQSPEPFDRLLSGPGE